MYCSKYTSLYYTTRSSDITSFLKSLHRLPIDVRCQKMTDNNSDVVDVYLLMYEGAVYSIENADDD